MQNANYMGLSAIREKHNTVQEAITWFVPAVAIRTAFSRRSACLPDISCWKSLARSSAWQYHSSPQHVIQVALQRTSHIQRISHTEEASSSSAFWPFKRFFFFFLTDFSKTGLDVISVVWTLLPVWTGYAWTLPPGTEEPRKGWFGEFMERDAHQRLSL